LGARRGSLSVVSRNDAGTIRGVYGSREGLGQGSIPGIEALNGLNNASTYSSANKAIGWIYDAAGNLVSDGTTSYSFDALGRLSGTSATGQTRSYGYNGDGALTSATVNGTSTSYTQDQAGGTSQVLASTSGGVSTDYLYANQSERLASLTSNVRTWYGTDNQGSVRQSA
jgi:YD repeat-containing protein